MRIIHWPQVDRISYTALRLAGISMLTKLPEVHDERREIQQATHCYGSWFRPKIQVRSTLDHVLVAKEPSDSSEAKMKQVRKPAYSF